MNAALGYWLLHSDTLATQFQTILNLDGIFGTLKPGGVVAGALLETSTSQPLLETSTSANLIET